MTTRQTPTAVVEFRILGPLEARIDGTAVDVGGPRQAQLLAVLLARRGAPVPTADLIEALWPDGDTTSADASLRSYVSRLRRSLAEAGAHPQPLVTESAGYRLDVPAAAVDADAFGAAVAEARDRAARGDHDGAIEAADSALARWRGRPFGLLADAPWAQGEVRRLADLRADVVETRLASLLGLGRHAQAVADAERAAEEHPDRERLHTLAALALYRAGRQADALRTLHAYRRRLADETGLQAGPEVDRLEAQILAHDPALAPPTAAPTQKLRSYVLGAPLGEGAFASVFRGTQPSVGRSVAIKVIRPELANRPEFVRRFEAEAHLVARLEHPHVVPLYDYWREPDRACLVMRLLRGGTLEQELSARGALPLGAIVTLARQVGGALGAAHRAGVVHRDVKPANVFLDGEGNFYLGDFGIALEVAQAAEPEASLSAGSPAYASPEQLRREPVGPQADVFALGVTLYEAFTARLPFPDETTQAALLRRQLHDAIPLVRLSRTDVPAAVDEVLGRATAKDPADRHPRVEQFVDELVAALGGDGPPGAVARPRPPAGTATAVGLDAPNPYKGLRAFTEADAADFFGRARLVDQLVGLLAREGAAGRVLAVVGPSGMGKSSVVRAGLLPALARGAVAGSDGWYVASMLPGRDPFEELAPTLLKVAVNPPPADLARLLAEDHRGLTRAVKAIVPDGAVLLLVVDQFEELFTLTQDENLRRRFLDSLEHALTDLRCPLRVVLTLRADFYDRPLQYGGFARLLRDSTVALLPLAPDELERAIVDPAARVGCSFEPGLVSRIVADVADQPAALPILQYALTRLYEERVSGMLTQRAYDELGGVAGALARRAEDLYGEATAAEQQATRRLFTRLVTLGEGAEDTRRRVDRCELGPGEATAAVIERFGVARLLSFDRDPASREPTVEVAHEALIARWPRLRAWLEDDRDGLRVQRHLTEAAHGWDAAGRDPAELYRGGRLDAATEWAAAHADDVNPLEAAFLHAARAERDAERERELRHVRRLRTSLAAVAVVAALALVAGVVAAIQQRRSASNADLAAAEADRARAATLESDLTRLVAESRAEASTNRQLSLLLGLEAQRIRSTADGQAALLRALLSEPRFTGALPTPEPVLAATVWGDEVVGVTPDRSILRWDADSAALGGSVEPDGPAVAHLPVDLPGWSAAFGSRRIVQTGTQDGTVGGAAGKGLTVTDLEPGLSPVAPIGPPAWPVSAFDLSADDSTVFLAGSRAAVPGSAGGLVAAYDLTSGSRRWEVDTSAAGLGGLGVSPDGRLVAVAGADRSTTVLDAHTGAVVLGPLSGLRSGGNGRPRFSPDGRSLAVVSGYPAEVVVFDLGSGTVRWGPQLVDRAQAVLAWSPDGAILATCNASGSVTVLDGATGRTAGAPLTLNDACISVAFASSGRELVATGTRQVLRFDLGGATTFGSAVGGPPPQFGLWSPNGSRLALVGDDAVVVVDAASGRPVAGPIPAGPHLPAAVQPPGAAFSPDGARLAVGGTAGVRIVDLSTGAQVGPTITEPTLPAVWDLEFSPDGTRLALGGPGRARVFDVASGQPAGPLLGDGSTLQPVYVNFGADDRILYRQNFLGRLQRIDWSTGAVLAEVPASSSAVSRDGGVVVTTQISGLVERRDPVTLELVGEPIQVTANALTSSAIDPSGTTALASHLGSTYLVRLADGYVFRPPLPGNPMGAAGVAPDGSRVALRPPPSEPGWGTVVWSLDPAVWESRACELVGRNLTAAEWARYLPNGGSHRKTCDQWALTAR